MRDMRTAVASGRKRREVGFSLESLACLPCSLTTTLPFLPSLVEDLLKSRLVVLEVELDEREGERVEFVERFKVEEKREEVCVRY
jgi:hypothetical protein